MYKLNPAKWHTEQVRNHENPVDIMIDMGPVAKDWQALSQHGAYCMDVLYTEALLRVGYARQVKGYLTVGNDVYSKAGDAILNP